MTHYYKVVENGIIKQVGVLTRPTKLYTPLANKAEYQRLKALMEAHPENTLETIYELKDDTETYEGRENTPKEKADWYLDAVQKGALSLDEVPEEFRAEIEEKLPNNPYGLSDELYLQVKKAEEKRVEEEILKEVQNEY